MSRFSKFLSFALTFSTLVTASTMSVAAPDMTVVGTQQTPIVLHSDPNATNGTLNDGSPITTVSTPILEISPSAAEELKRRVEHLNQGAMPQASVGAPHVDLGMGGVPVLNQGVHGTCVTFAVTAALDAAVYHQDKISQLCSLELGSFLENKDYNYISGWSGSFAPLVLEQFNTYGAITKEHEKSGVCGGLKSYPVRSSYTGSPMSIDKYTSLAQDVMRDINVDEILSGERAFSRYVNRDAVVESIKSSLRDGHRVVAGLGLDPSAYNAGFVGNHKTSSDTWVVTDILKSKVSRGEFNKLGYHEIVIHGYDDDAVVNGQRGVFIIRNSWSDRFGDKGDAYVTYDYVKLLLTEANAIVTH